MTDSDEYSETEPIPGANDSIKRGIDTFDQTFWLKVTDVDGFVWDLLGRYRAISGDVAISEVRVGAAEEETSGPKELDPELLRRLTRVQPIKSRIRQQIAEDRARFQGAVEEAEASGRSAGILTEWAELLSDAHRQIKPWQSRYPDSDWAAWAADYLARVRSSQSAYGVQRDIAHQEAWGTQNYETVRARIRRMRDYDWIVAKGHLVEEGPRLLRWLEDGKDESDG